ncbi:MAG: hypothetical protein ACTSUD_01495, partial [Alphaproteobacteria bacterium]
MAAGTVLAHLGSIDRELRNVLIIAKTSRTKKNRRVYYVGPAFEEALLSAAGDKFNVGFLLGVSSHLAQSLENPTDFAYQFCRTTDAIGRAIYFRAMAAALLLPSGRYLRLPTAPGPMDHKRHILLVEDTPSFAQTYIEYLRGEPYVVAHVESGEAALASVRER